MSARDEMLRWFLRMQNQPTVFSDHGHLNKVPIKIQSSSLLIGSGSDGQHGHRLFWFQTSTEFKSQLCQLHGQIWASVFPSAILEC